MDIKLADKLNKLFRTEFPELYSHEVRNIIDKGKVSVSYYSPVVGVNFSCGDPKSTYEILSRVDDKSNWCARPDITKLMNDRIHPVSLTFYPANYDYVIHPMDRMDFYEEGEHDNAPTPTPYLEPIIIQFYHPDDPSKIKLGEITIDNLYDEGFLGPTMREFLAKLNSLEKWSDLDFMVFTDSRKIQASLANFNVKSSWQPS